jgi:hypothetical protein
MSTIDIHLSGKFTPYLRRESARRGYKDVSAFIDALVEAEKERKTEKEIEGLLLEAVDGPFEEWTDKDVADIRRVGTQMIKRRRQRKSR